MAEKFDVIKQQISWLGNLKHRNLVDEFSTDGRFCKLFAGGVQDIQVKEGYIYI